MKKFRHWLFELLTGYDLVTYEDLLREWNKALNLAESVNETAKGVNDLATKVNNDAMELLKHFKNAKQKDETTQN